MIRRPLAPGNFRPLWEFPGLCEEPELWFQDVKGKVIWTSYLEDRGASQLSYLRPGCSLILSLSITMVAWTFVSHLLLLSSLCNVDL